MKRPRRRSTRSTRRPAATCRRPIATGAALVILIVACLLLSVDLFVLLVVVFMILALWELRVDFATVGLHLPVFMLWLCSSFTLIATYYSPYHLITMSLSIIVSIILVAIAASAKISVGATAYLWRLPANCPTRSQRAPRILV